ncbi:hypothetical protein P3G55_03980 [Leptospira sp. 96542]|nr:hypothetical protein [Leptospira sp. 96542]
MDGSKEISRLWNLQTNLPNGNSLPDGCTHSKTYESARSVGIKDDKI